MIDTQLQNKVVLITGINNPLGIGAAAAKAFAVEGARILGTYLHIPSIGHPFVPEFS
jgi:3-oxoacyl-[acyl-carrier protein] reductase